MAGAEEWGEGPDEDSVAPNRENPEISLMEERSSMEAESLRRPPATQKLAVATSLIRDAYRLKGAWFWMSEPELSEEQLRKRVLEGMATLPRPIPRGYRTAWICRSGRGSSVAPPIPPATIPTLDSSLFRGFPVLPCVLT